MKHTDNKFWTYLRSALRRANVRYPLRYQALQNAKRPYQGENKRRKFEYQCNECKEWFAGKDVQVDHIKPCGALTEPKHIESFVLTLFCEGDNLQVLCKQCHNSKTKMERAK